MQAWKITAAAILASLCLVASQPAQAGLLLGEPAILTKAHQIITLTATCDNVTGPNNFQRVMPDGSTLPVDVLYPKNGGTVFLVTKVVVDLQGTSAYTGSATLNLAPFYAYGMFGYFFNITNGSGSTTFSFPTGLPIGHAPNTFWQVFTSDPTIQPPTALAGTLKLTFYCIQVPPDMPLAPIELLLLDE
jgi:hypothetical protein